jgi:hypothetical protein
MKYAETCSEYAKIHVQICKKMREYATSGRLPHGIYHPKSGIYHLRYIPWYIPKRKMVYIMVYTIDIYHGIYHYYHGIYHRYIPWYI